MSNEELQDATREWLDGLIFAYKLLGKEFNPEDSEEYINCPRCIEVRPSDKEMHLIGVKKIAEILGFNVKCTRKDIEDKTYDISWFYYKGHRFFEYVEKKEG